MNLAVVVPPMATLSPLKYDDLWTLYVSATGASSLSALVKSVAVCV